MQFAKEVESHILMGGEHLGKPRFTADTQISTGNMLLAFILSKYFEKSLWLYG